MPGRIDNLFSPQRLRQNWKKPADSQRGEAGKAGEASKAGETGKAGEAAKSPHGRPQGAAAGATAVAAAVMAEFELLRSLTHQQFPENQRKILDMMLEELHQLLKEHKLLKDGMLVAGGGTPDAGCEMRDSGERTRNAGGGRQDLMGGEPGADGEIQAEDAREQGAQVKDARGQYGQAEDAREQCAVDEAPKAEAGGDMAALRQPIEDALNHIEDLMEAWDV